MTGLNTRQLEIITTNARTFDALEHFLSSDLRERFIEFQKRAGDAYAAGQWAQARTEEIIIVENRSVPPTLEETQEILEEVLQQLQTGKRYAAMERIQTVQRLLAKTVIASIVGGLPVPMKDNALSEQQLWVIYQNLGWLEPLCDAGVLENKKLEDQLSDFCLRIAKSHNVTPLPDDVPKLREAKELFGIIFLELDDDKKQAKNMVKDLMNLLEFVPSAPATMVSEKKEVG